ncbi:MAG: type II toxin-antitoxin system VapC family toxin [Thiofilum sp.]|uniref:type II toxin-antitoxin system VapC family toxin n=1 Tax=Thiofilum sp. TaxID=2212733 RepID=UPI0025E03416|nr:type II toxin-antitoxin system VapC family toxin [Thiofilum sp.]MBK8453311.1 type II toxin-antitoxin system VapC family toxin [Thiofilum sp.]
MIEIDTNIIVRYLVKDDERQALEATQFLDSHNCMVLPTVLLETVWVLSSKNGYGWAREQVVSRLRHLLGLPAVYTPSPDAIYTALAWYEAGMDFGDALHLAHSGTQFATFDKPLHDKAKRLQSNKMVILLGEKSH